MYNEGMLTRRNTKEEMLTLIDEQEAIIEKLKERELLQAEKSQQKIILLRKSRDIYKEAYESQRKITKKRDTLIKFLETENIVHMKGKVALQNDLFERDLLIHSLMNN